MSRCFPYPPPEYLRQGLVESIKLEREKVLPKTEEQKRKREKKEKKGRKEKGKTQGHSKKYKKLDDVLNGYKDDQLETSDLTEEHEPPVSYVSDVSQNSNKRRRDNLSSAECSVDGNKIKIRFSLKKPRVPDASSGKEPVCSTFESADSSYIQPKVKEQPNPLSKKVNAVAPVPQQNQWLYDERRGQVTLPEQKQSSDDERSEQIPSSFGTSVYDTESQKAALLNKTLIEDWVLSPLQLSQSAAYDSDEDWLFKTTRQQGTTAAKKSGVDDGLSCRASATSCPRAQFLPEAEIFAFPYTVPF